MPDPADTPEPDGYALVLPFVVVASQGGPFDDAAFTAGWHCGEIDRRLATITEAGGTRYEATVQTATVPQLDLIAMRHGWTLASDPVETSQQWSNATFTRGETDHG